MLFAPVLKRIRQQSARRAANKAARAAALKEVTDLLPSLRHDAMWRSVTTFAPVVRYEDGKRLPDDKAPVLPVPGFPGLRICWYGVAKFYGRYYVVRRTDELDFVLPSGALEAVAKTIREHFTKCDTTKDQGTHLA